jgi:hypothetical protein
MLSKQRILKRRCSLTLRTMASIAITEVRGKQKLPLWLSKEHSRFFSSTWAELSKYQPSTNPARN